MTIRPEFQAFIHRAGSYRREQAGAPSENPRGTVFAFPPADSVELSRALRIGSLQDNMAALSTHLVSLGQPTLSQTFVASNSQRFHAELQSLPRSVRDTANLLVSSTTAAVGGPVSLSVGEAFRAAEMLDLKVLRKSPTGEIGEQLATLFVDPTAGAAFVEYGNIVK